MSRTPGGSAITELGGWLDEASAQRQLPDPHLAVDDVRGTNRANSALYIRALRSRLASLGYLEGDDARGDELTPLLSAAIRAFQQDAGFSEADIDGWAGPQTKTRLQQLVSFEEEQEPQHWGPLGQQPADYPAAGRALYLRLYTLGFLPWEAKPGPATEFRLEHNPQLQAALARFLRCAQQLGLAEAQWIESNPVPRLDCPTLTLLFGQDALIQALADHPEFIRDEVNARFVDAISRVELWLLGYDITIAGQQEKIRRQSGSHGPHNVPSYIWFDPLAAALADFTRKFPAASLDAENPGFSPAFFTQLAALQQEDPATGNITDELITQAIAHQESLMDKLGQLASRIWDGAKRLWAWLKRAVSSAGEWLEDELWNLARFVARSARESGELVFKAIDILHHGAVYLRGKVFPGSDPALAVIDFAMDFDTRLFINAVAPTRQALALVEKEAGEVRYFTASCRILQALLKTLADLLRLLAVGSGGWFLLLLALSRAAADIKALHDTMAGLEAVDLGAASLYRNPVV